MPKLVNVILERDGFISLQAAAASEAVLTHGSVSRHQSDGMTDQNHSVHYRMILGARLIHHTSFSNGVHSIIFLLASLVSVFLNVFLHM